MKAGYKIVMNVLKKEGFGSRKISDIRISDAKLWLIQMQKNGRGYSSIHTIRGVLRPAFQMAVDDDVLLKNLILSILLYTFFSRMFDLCCLLQ